MPRGASPKREREYNKLQQKFRKSGRYKGREKEVAARIVNKQRAMHGETTAEKKKDRQGKSPDRDLPMKNYQHLTIDQIMDRLHRLSDEQIAKIRSYEKGHKNRKTLLQEMAAGRS